jgi:hypothetical protein
VCFWFVVVVFLVSSIFLFLVVCVLMSIVLKCLQCLLFLCLKCLLCLYFQCFMCLCLQRLCLQLVVFWVFSVGCVKGCVLKARGEMEQMRSCLKLKTIKHDIKLSF